MAKYLLSYQALPKGWIRAKKEDILLWLRGRRTVAHDSETSGLEFFSPTKEFLLLWQLGDDVDQFVIDLRYTTLDFLIPHFEDKSIVKVAHNRSYDMNVLLSHLPSVRLMDASWRCTLIMSKELYCGMDDMQYSLNACCYRELGANVEKEQQRSFINHKAGVDFTDKQLDYSAKDPEVTMKLYKALYDKVIEKELQATHKLDMSIEMWYMTRVGMPFDPEAWMELYKKTLPIYEKQLVVLDKFIIDHFPEAHKLLKITGYLWEDDGDRLLKCPTSSKKEYFNWSSGPQVMEYIFKPIGFNCLDKTGKQSAAFEAVMENFPFVDDGILKEFLKVFLDFCKLKAGVTTFGEKFLTLKSRSYKETEVTHRTNLFGETEEIVTETTIVEPGRPTINPYTNRIHYGADIVLSTGRIAFKKPNMANIPAISEYRTCFKPKEGYMVQVADYPGQEDKIMAVLAKDLTKIDFIINGHGDTHSFVASTMYSAKMKTTVWIPPKVDKEEIDPKGFRIWNETPKELKALRHKGKVLNFLLSFGGSAHALKTKLSIPLEEAEELVKLFWQEFPELYAFFQSYREFALENGFVVFNSISQRKRYFSNWGTYKEMEEKRRWYMNTYGRDWNAVLKKDEKKLDRSERLLSMFSKIRGAIEREAGNTPIQGTGSDMLKTALQLMQRKYDAYNRMHNADIRPIISIHDETGVETPIDHIKAGVAIQKESMEEAFKIFLWDKGVPNIPINIAVNYAPSWNK